MRRRTRSPTSERDRRGYGHRPASRRRSTLGVGGGFKHNVEEPSHSVCSTKLTIRSVDMKKSTPGNIPFNQTIVLRRRVICMLSNRNFRPQEAHLASHLPLHFCSCVVFGYFSTTSDGKITPRYKQDVAYLTTLVAAVKKSPVNMPVLLSLGGDESSGANISLALRSASRRSIFGSDFATYLVRLGLSGAYLDWRTPGGECGDASDRDAFVDFITSVRSALSWIIQKPVIIIRVPNDNTKVQNGFDMIRLNSIVDYMVIATTSEVDSRSFGDVIGCVNDHKVVIEAHLYFASTLPASAARKFCYSLELSPRTYVSDETRLGGLSLGVGAQQGLSQRPGYVAHFELCDGTWTTPSRQKRGDCSVTYRASTVTNHFDIAVYESEANLGTRFLSLSKEGLGDACVAVHDVEMDDFRNICGRGLSPHLQTVATRPQRTLLPLVPPAP
ncbi:uncharacterized protein LOC135399674 isoform X2 [Ornithodoros turicata]|uniref:uncharacterized protein LOC135399674 isoform X2 n=1 Tax=Ornithodoros turicata TaxID=34597 RepID=UPI003139ACDB